jgi:hypothetical protein
MRERASRSIGADGRHPEVIGDREPYLQSLRPVAILTIDVLIQRTRELLAVYSEGVVRHSQEGYPREGAGAARTPCDSPFA